MSMQVLLKHLFHIKNNQAVAELVLQQSNPGWREQIQAEVNKHIHEMYYYSKEELEQQAIHSLSSSKLIDILTMIKYRVHAKRRRQILLCGFCP